MKPLRILLLAFLSLLLCAGCDSGGSSSDDPDTPAEKSAIALISGSGSPDAVQPLAVITESSGQKTTVLGSYNSAGEVASVSGAMVSRGDGGAWVYIFSADGDTGYFYGIDTSGGKEPLVLGFDYSVTDSLSLQLWDNDWVAGTAVSLGSSVVSLSGASSSLTPKLVLRAARATDGDNKEVETSLFEAFKTFIEHRTHYIVNKTLGIYDKIKEMSSDGRLSAFVEGLSTTVETLDTINESDKTDGYEEPTVLPEAEATAIEEEVSDAITDETGASVIAEESAGLILVSGNNQVGSPNTNLVDPIVVKLVNANNEGRAGIELELYTAAGVMQTLMTGADGTASFTWKLSAGVGEKYAGIRLKNPVPFKGMVYLNLKAEAKADSDWVSCTIGGIAFKEYGTAYVDSVTLTIGTRIRLTYKMTCTPSGSPSKIYISFQEAANGTYTWDASTGGYFPNLEFWPYDNSALLGLTMENYWELHTGGCKYPETPDVTITVHQDATKYWGTFSGKIYSGTGESLTVTDGKFMKLK